MRVVKPLCRCTQVTSVAHNICSPTTIRLYAFGMVLAALNALVTMCARLQDEDSDFGFLMSSDSDEDGRRRMPQRMSQRQQERALRRRDRWGRVQP